MMERAASSLSYAARPAVLRYYLSRLALVLAGLTTVPAVAAFWLGELRLGMTLAITILLLVLLWLPGRRTAAPRTLQVNEALATVALTFLLTPLLMLLPFRSQGLSLEDALFESVSAITTTGLSTVPYVHDYSPGLLLLRAWMQWYGGLGIAVFSLALMLGHRAGARHLAGLEAVDDLSSSARTYAHRVLMVYLTLTLVALCALWLTLGDGMQALLHALSAISTGGFSGYDDSLADMPSVAARWLTIGTAVLGAMPLILYYQAVTERRLEPAGDPEWWVLLVAILSMTGLLTLALHAESAMSWSTALYHGSLLGASAQTTAGFSTLRVAELGDTGKMLLILSMLAGGSVGSTAGGIKLLRLLILVELMAYILRRTTMSRHAVTAMRFSGRKLDSEEVQRVLLVIVLFTLTVVLSWAAMVAGGYPALPALFDVVSATSTVGLSAGVVSQDMAVGYKLLLCLDMLLGRLEILALLVVLYPPTWLGRRIKDL